VAIVCMIIAGFVLDYFKQTYLFMGYIVIFTIAFLGRLVSSVYFLKQYEPEFKPDKKAYFTIFQFIKKMAFNNFGRFVLFYTLMMFAVNIAAPFFAVYMLKNLGFSYTAYMAIILSSAVSSLIFMPVWGKFSDIYGNLKTMRLTSRLIPLVPFLWIISIYIFLYNSAFVIPYLIVIELFSGIIWAGFNLAAGNFIYDAVSRERMAICTSYFNIISGIGLLVGALLGGFIASFSFSLFGLDRILIVFLLSGIARYLVHASMASKIEEVREVMHFNGNIARKKIAKLTLAELKIKELEKGIKGASKTKFLEIPDPNLLRIKR